MYDASSHIITTCSLNKDLWSHSGRSSPHPYYSQCGTLRFYDYCSTMYCFPPAALHAGRAFLFSLFSSCLRIGQVCILDPCYDRGNISTFLVKKKSESRAPPLRNYPIISLDSRRCFATIFVVYLRHGVVHLGFVLFFFNFWVRLTVPRVKSPRKVLSYPYPHCSTPHQDIRSFRYYLSEFSPPLFHLGNPKLLNVVSYRAYTFGIIAPSRQWTPQWQLNMVQCTRLLSSVTPIDRFISPTYCLGSGLR